MQGFRAVSALLLLPRRASALHTAARAPCLTLRLRLATRQSLFNSKRLEGAHDFHASRTSLCL